jgi:hypothetical protein
MTDLTDAERCIQYEGMYGSSLVEILNSWVLGEDAPYWNRKGTYVPQLIPAAISLLQRGMIEVWEQPLPLGVGEGGLMTSDLAAQALADPRNWWGYDPDDNWDPNEDLSRYADLADDNAEPMTTLYSVCTTEAARQRGISLWPSSPPGPAVPLACH